MVYKKQIFAYYDDLTIRVYQAFNRKIALDASKNNKFGENYNLNRMSWIKTSFLWMMYRSNWGNKKNQEYILAIDMRRDIFDEFLEKAVLTSDDSPKYKFYNEWKIAFDKAEIYCQWDPDRDIYGNSINRFAIQIGLKGTELKKFINEGIVTIRDITPKVRKMRKKVINQNIKISIPKEKLYAIKKDNIILNLDMM